MNKAFVLPGVLAFTSFAIPAAADVITFGEGILPVDLAGNPTNIDGDIGAGTVIVVNQLFTNFRDGTIEVNSNGSNTELSANGSLLIGTAGGVPTLAPEARGAVGELRVLGPLASVFVQNAARVGSSDPFNSLRPDLVRGGEGIVTIEGGGTLAIAPDLDEANGTRGMLSIGEVVGSFISNGTPISLDVNGPDEFNGVVIVDGVGSEVLAGNVEIGRFENGSTGQVSIIDGGRLSARNGVSLSELISDGFFFGAEEEIEELRQFGVQDTDVVSEEGRIRIGFGSQVQVLGDGSVAEAAQLFVGAFSQEALSSDLASAGDTPAAELLISDGGTVSVNDYLFTDYAQVGVGGTGRVAIGDFDGTDSGRVSTLSLAQRFEEFVAVFEENGESFEIIDEREVAFLSSLASLYIGGNQRVVSGGETTDLIGDGLVEVGRNGRLEVDADIEIGIDDRRLQFFDFEDLASGELRVSSGGVVQVGFKSPGFDIFNTGDINVNANGRLTGDGGTIDANVVLNGGAIAPGASPGILNILGDLNAIQGLIEIEIAGTEPGQYDQLNVGGNLIAETGLDIEINFLDGFLPQSGDVFDFLNVAGSAPIFDTPSLIRLSVNGGGAFGDAASLSFENGSISLLSGFSGDGGGDIPDVAPIPVPAGLPLLLAGISGLWWAGSRRRNPTTA